MKIKFNLKKKTLTAISIVLGVALLASSVYADVVNRSPYEQFKDAVKSTSAQMSGQIRNYTMQTTFSLKDNETLLLRTTSLQKVDGQRSETVEMTDIGKGPFLSSYNFYDENQSIWYDRYSDTYYLTEFNRPEGYVDHVGGYASYDPLAEDYISDIERIVDAFVGNLKNYISLDQGEDGSKHFSGSLSDAEIPALVNAVASFVTKQYLMSSGNFYTNQAAEPVMAVDIRDTSMPLGNETYYDENRILIPSLDGDVYIKSMNGQATANPDNLFTNLTATIVLSGKDSDGNRHDLTFDISMVLTDLAETAVTPPDLTGKKVQNNTNYEDRRNYRITEKFVGTYRNDIIIEEDQSFVKIGERTIVIESITEQSVTGSYSESFLVEQEGREPLAFEFTAENNDPYSLGFTYTGRNGQTVYGYFYFDPAAASIQFYDESDKGLGWFNPTFIRVFD